MNPGLDPRAYAMLAAHLPDLQDVVARFARVWERACAIDPAAAHVFGASYAGGLPSFDELAAAVAGLQLGASTTGVPSFDDVAAALEGLECGALAAQAAPEARLQVSAVPLFDRRPWPALVGDAVTRAQLHAWLDEVLDRYLDGVEDPSYRPGPGEPRVRYARALALSLNIEAAR